MRKTKQLAIVEARARRGPNEGALTPRDYFAAQAMQAILTNNQLLNSISCQTQGPAENVVDCIARTSFGYADAMMKYR